MVALSRGCAVCRKRKIKCDELRPICTPCAKAGWECGGYREDLIFRHETATVVQKARSRYKHLQASQPLSSSGTQRSQKKSSPPVIDRQLHPPIQDQGIAFFMTNYVNKGAGSFRGFQEYLPELYCKEGKRTALSTVITAAGLATLSNAAKQPDVGASAREMYLAALRMVSEALVDPLRVKSDQTLAAVMLLGLFEAVSCGGREAMKSSSMDSWRQHIRGVAQLINIRGPEQFKSEGSLRLFLQIRRLILISFSQMCEPIPYSLKVWSEWAESIQRHDEIPANRLAELISDLISLRAWIRGQREASPSRKISKLLHMDRKFMEWADDLPKYWHFTTRILLQASDGDATDAGLDQQDDIYADFYAASMWLSYRSARIQLHVALMPLIMADNNLSLSSKRSALEHSRDILKTMTRGICYSYSFIMGDIGAKVDRNAANIKSERGFGPAPGGYMLIWPLYLVGMLDTTTRDQRYWIAERLKRIGICSGASLAMARAKALFIAAEDEFRESEHWPYINEKADPATVWMLLFIEGKDEAEITVR